MDHFDAPFYSPPRHEAYETLPKYTRIRLLCWS